MDTPGCLPSPGPWTRHTAARTGPCAQDRGGALTRPPPGARPTTCGAYARPRRSTPDGRGRQPAPAQATTGAPAPRGGRPRAVTGGPAARRGTPRRAAGLPTTTRHEPRSPLQGETRGHALARRAPPHFAARAGAFAASMPQMKDNRARRANGNLTPALTRNAAGVDTHRANPRPRRPTASAAA